MVPPLPKLLNTVLIPPGSIAAIGALGLALAPFQPRIGAALEAFAVLVLWILSLPLVARALTRALSPYPALELVGAAGKADAIVIMGRGYRPEVEERGNAPWLDALGLERVAFGAQLHRWTGKPILVTGGDVYGRGASEGALMKAALADWGIEARDVDTTALNTWDNARRAHALLSPRGETRIFLVTHALEMWRAAATFRHVGFEVVPAPMGAYQVRRLDMTAVLPDPEAFRYVCIACYEAVGMLYYRLSGLRG